MRHDKIIVTTTHNLEGIKINEYIKPVTAHVVVGMNFFKDVFSGLTDIFGGNSSSYESTLKSINESVLNKLKQEAYSQGANCIVGLKIDNDEVSSQGKSMMMVTASGTAIKADIKQNDSDIEKTMKSDRIDSVKLSILTQKEEYLEKINTKKHVVASSVLKFATKNRLDEFAPYILAELEKKINDSYSSESLEHHQKNFYSYFSSASPKIIIKLIYAKINLESNTKFREFLIKMIKDLKLVDYNEILKKLQIDEFQTKKSFAAIATFEKDTYSKSDIETLQKVLKIINESFPETSQQLVKKSKLFGKEMEIWICQCSHENALDSKYCSKCKKDKQGFLTDETKPSEAISSLRRKINALKGFFN